MEKENHGKQEEQKTALATLYAENKNQLAMTGFQKIVSRYLENLQNDSSPETRNRWLSDIETTTEIIMRGSLEDSDAANTANKIVNGLDGIVKSMPVGLNDLEYDKLSFLYDFCEQIFLKTTLLVSTAKQHPGFEHTVDRGVLREADLVNFIYHKYPTLLPELGDFVMLTTAMMAIENKSPEDKSRWTESVQALNFCLLNSMLTSKNQRADIATTLSGLLLRVTRSFPDSLSGDEHAVLQSISTLIGDIRARATVLMQYNSMN